MKNMKPLVIIIYGYPGSGKGTQAEKVAEYFNFEHLETSKLIEGKIKNPANQNDLIIQREKDFFNRGILCTPEWVSEIIKEAIVDLHQQNKGIVFSSSPRTLHEAEEEIPLLENLFGKENIFTFEIKIKPETSLFRNSHRKICEKCRRPVVYTPENASLENCPVCGGKLVKRGSLDDPEVIKVRHREYEERTMPILNYLRERGYEVIEIDGEPASDEVTKNIFDKLPK